METYAPLPGTQDWLFDAARKLRRCEAALFEVFEKAGYAEVIPPTVEAANVFGAEAFRALDRSGRLVALRADFTAQVARIAATRLAKVSPLRLHYRGSVVRRLGEGPVHERLQAGCELVGAPGAEADAEVLSLASRSLRALGLDQARISIGSTGYFSALANAAGADEKLSHDLIEAIDRKDLPGLESLCAQLPASKAREAIVTLAQPRPAHEPPSDRAKRELQRLHEVIGKANDPRLELDLGEVRGLGYYTGIVFNLYAPGAPKAVGGGGRYDSLLGRFGDPRPAVGFSLDLDELVALC